MGENITGEREDSILGYNWGSFRLRIWDREQDACDGGIGEYIHGRVRRGSGKWPGWFEARIRYYIYGCLRWWIGYCGRNACERGMGVFIPGRRK
jgi:hypothetical protein